jgi:hypothetical protein
VAARAGRARHQHRPVSAGGGRYRLMPEIIDALAASGTPFSVLTKGTLLRRDLPLLAEARRPCPSTSRCRSPCPTSAAADPRSRSTDVPGTAGHRAGGDRGGVRRDRVPHADRAAPDRLRDGARRCARAHRGIRRFVSSSEHCTCVPVPGSGSGSGWSASTRTRARVSRALPRRHGLRARRVPEVARGSRAPAAATAPAHRWSEDEVETRPARPGPVRTTARAASSAPAASAPCCSDRTALLRRDAGGPRRERRPPESATQRSTCAA